MLEKVYPKLEKYGQKLERMYPKLEKDVYPKLEKMCPKLLKIIVISEI